MSDNTQPSTTPSVRKLRHSIRKRAYVAMMMTRGVPGATKEQQIQVFDQQIKLLEEALEKAKQARDIVFMRDFDAHQEEKKAAQAAEKAHDDVDLPDEVKSEFDALVAKLSGQFDAEHGGFKDEDGDGEDKTQPPF